MTKRVAIVFYGLTRNLRATFPSIKKYIFKAFESAGVEFDVYLHTYFLETLTNFRSGEDNVPLDNDEWKMLYPYRYLIDIQDEVDKLLPHDEFCLLENPWAATDPTRNSMRNLLRQLYSLQRAWTLLEEEEKYDGYLILRPDLDYQFPLRIPRKLPVAEKDVFMPQWGAGEVGANDRVCFTSYEGARVIMNRLNHVMEYGRLHPPHSQLFLRHILETNGLQERPLWIYAKRVRAGDESVEIKQKSMKWYSRALADFDMLNTRYSSPTRHSRPW